MSVAMSPAPSLSVPQRGHFRSMPEKWPSRVRAACSDLHHADPDSITILEFSGVRLLSAAGLTELVDLRDRLTRTGARLALVGASPSVRRVLTITGLDRTMMLADTLPDAVELITTPISRRPRPLSLVSETRFCGIPRRRPPRT